MHSFTLAAALLPLLAAAIPAPQNIGCGTNLGQLPCTTATAEPTPSPSPPQPSIVPASESPEEQWEADNHNSDIVTCKTSWDCNDWCQSKMGNAHITSTCETYTPPGVSLDGATGQCLCYNNDVIDDLILGLGDAICLAVNDAVYDTAMIASYLIPYVGEAAGGASQLYRLGSKVLRAGAKDCGINACPGHKYTVVDPDDFQSQAGILACD